MTARYTIIPVYPTHWIVVNYATKVEVAAGSPDACIAAARLLNMETT